MHDKKMWVVHYTDYENFKKIKDTGVIKSAWSLMNAEEKQRYVYPPRPYWRDVSGGKLRDQIPLTKGKIPLVRGITCEQYLKCLNKHVFFWPTRYEGNRRRKNFRNRYPGECAIFVRLCELQEEILFSRYNSGAVPRDASKKRDCNLFKPLKDRQSNEPIVEIVIRGKAILPSNTRYCINSDREPR